MNATWLGLSGLALLACGGSAARPGEGSAQTSGASQEKRSRDGRVEIAAPRPPTVAPPEARPVLEEPDRSRASETPPHLTAADSPFRAARPSEPSVSPSPLDDPRWRLVLERSDATAPRIWINASGRSVMDEALQLSNCTASRYLRGELLGHSGSCRVSVLLPRHVEALRPPLQARMAKAFVADRVCVSSDGRDDCVEIVEWQQADDALVNRVFEAIASEE